MDPHDIPLLDFERASVAWKTKTGSLGRWRLVASALAWRLESGSSDRVVLASQVFAGDVYGHGRLPRDPPYSFQLFASRDRHGIVREYGFPFEQHDSQDLNTSVFSELQINEPTRPARIINIAASAGDLSTSWPLVVRLRASGRDSGWILEFPANHINTRAALGRTEFQVETGPILVPEALVDAPRARMLNGFCLAYVFFNRLDKADILLFASKGPCRTFDQFGQLRDVEIELHATNG